jgi:hypothetical protein
MRALALTLSVALAWSEPTEEPAGRAPPPPVRCGGAGAPTLREAGGNVAVARFAAERRAKRAARQACRVAVRSLPLRGGGTAGSALDRDAALAEELEVALRRAKGAGVPRYFADGGVALELEVRLEGELGRLIAPQR